MVGQSVGCDFWWLSETCEHNTTVSLHDILTMGWEAGHTEEAGEAASISRHRLHPAVLQ